MSKETTERNKQFKINRQTRLALRKDKDVSANCLKKREERRRNNTPELRREATQAGERQFGNQAKGHHLHQRANHLATALTPQEFQRITSVAKSAAKQKTTIVFDGMEG